MMRNGTIDRTDPIKAHLSWRTALLAACFVGAFVITVMAPQPVADLMISGAPAYAKDKGQGKGQGKGLATAPGQAGEQDEEVVDMGETAPDADDRAIADGGGDSMDAADNELPADVPPANITVIKELAGLPENSALSEEEEMEAIRNGWGTWRTADGPETILAQ